jgi:hypothetical protein
MYIVCMADIVVRNIPEALVRKFRSDCALKGISVREWLLPKLEAEYGLGKVEEVEPSQGLPSVRGGVRGEREAKRVGAVLGPQHEAQSDRGAVGGGAQQDHGNERVEERKKLSAEEYMKMSKSEKSRAVSQGRFP